MCWPKGVTEHGLGASGTNIKHTEAKGATPSQKRIGSANGQVGAVSWRIAGQADAVLFTIDASGNVGGPALRLVLPPPK